MVKHKLPKDRKEPLESLRSAFLVEASLNGQGLIYGTIEILGPERSVIKTTEGDYVEVPTKEIRIRDSK